MVAKAVEVEVATAVEVEVAMGARVGAMGAKAGAVVAMVLGALVAEAPWMASASTCRSTGRRSAPPST